MGQNKVLSDKQAAKLMYAIDSMDEYYKREIIGIPSRIRVNKILKELKVIKNKKVLDVGCEAGHISMELAQKGAKVTAIDLIEEPLEKLKQILKTKPKLNNKITIQQADAQKLPFKKHQFDIILAAEVIEHMRRPEGFINGALKVLKPNGVLLITYPNEPLREKIYPFLSLMGINAGIESQVTLKSYTPEVIINKFAKKFNLIKHYRLPWWLPITHLMMFKPINTSSTRG